MYLLLGVIKILDNVIMTVKSITTYKNMRILSSLLVTASQLLFYLIIQRVLNDNSLTTILVVSISSGIGTYLAFVITDHFKKDSKWQYILCGSDVEDIKRLCNYLVEHNIKYAASYGLTRKGQDTINVMVFSKTKDESRLIERYLQTTDAKYLKEIMHG